MAKKKKYKTTRAKSGTYASGGAKAKPLIITLVSLLLAAVITVILAIGSFGFTVKDYKQWFKRGDIVAADKPTTEDKTPKIWGKVIDESGNVMENNVLYEMPRGMAVVATTDSAPSATTSKARSASAYAAPYADSTDNKQDWSGDPATDDPYVMVTAKNKLSLIDTGEITWSLTYTDDGSDATHCGVNLVGVVNSATVTVEFSGAFNRQMTLTATDEVGNTASTTIDYVKRITGINNVGMQDNCNPDDTASDFLTCDFNYDCNNFCYDESGYFGFSALYGEGTCYGELHVEALEIYGNKIPKYFKGDTDNEAGMIFTTVFDFTGEIANIANYDPESVGFAGFSTRDNVNFMSRYEIDFGKYVLGSYDWAEPFGVNSLMDRVTDKDKAIDPNVTVAQKREAFLTAWDLEYNNGDPNVSAYLIITLRWGNTVLQTYKVSKSMVSCMYTGYTYHDGLTLVNGGAIGF